MFQFICTYHQVAPEFASLLYSFGPQTGLSNDFHHTHLIQEYWNNPQCTIYSIPELGRSGRTMQLGFKLAAMEESDFDGKWTMREAAIYQSLDLSEGRLFWVIVKANDYIQKRITEASEKKSRSVHQVPKTMQESLKSALATHIIILGWCTEGWRWYISQMETETQAKLAKTTAAPIPSERETLDPSTDLKRALSSSGPGSVTPGTVGSAARTHVGSRMSDKPHSQHGGLTKNIEDMQRVAQQLLNPAKSAGDRQAQIERTMKQLRVMSDFSVKDLQRLGFISKKLREVKLVITMNLKILRELLEYWQTVFQTGSMPVEVIASCQNEFQDFERCVKAMQYFLESERLRTSTLLEQLEDGKNLVSEYLAALLVNMILTLSQVQPDPGIAEYQYSEAIRHKPTRLFNAYGDHVTENGVGNREHARNCKEHGKRYIFHARDHSFYVAVSSWDFSLCKNDSPLFK
jgi:hypothetical protein